MRFVDGLKELFKVKLFAIIFILFILNMVLFILSYTIITGLLAFSAFVILVMISFSIFTFILLVVSFFIPVSKMKLIIIFISILLTIPITIVFTLFGVMVLISNVFIYSNQFLTAFFAFKFCIDTSIKTDEYLYKKKGSIFTRSLEFILFLLLAIIFSILAFRFFKSSSILRVQNSGSIFSYLLWINVVLIIIALIRLIVMKKFAGYISMFFLLTFLYVLYILLDLWIGWYLHDNKAYDILSFIIDILIFLYIMGSIFERVDYIQDKLKIIRVDTIGLFVIVMKLVVQINKILQEIGFRMTKTELGRQIAIQAIVLLFLFIIFTLIIGIYYIFKQTIEKNQTQQIKK